MKYSFLFLLLFSFTVAFPQTDGSLAVKVTTTSTGLGGRNYAPRNCFAIWVADESGKFVKTLMVYAQQRRMHLNAWELATQTAGSTFNAVDAVSGATVNSHGTYTCSWDGTNFKGEEMPDGKYKIFMELTDIDASGKVTSFEITKGTVKITTTPPDAGSFKAVSLAWTPK